MNQPPKKDPEEGNAPSPLPALRGFQRKYLRGLSHATKPVVQVGREGLTKGVIGAIADALLTHELIKVRMYRPEDKKKLADQISEHTGAHLCGLIGHQAFLYRPHPEEPTIKLPKASGSKRSAKR